MSEPPDRRYERSPGGASGGIRPGAVIGGIVLGFVAAFLWTAVGLIGLYASLGDSSSSVGNLVGFAVLALPLLVAVVLLVVPRYRQAGAGFTMGLAIGVIVLAGVCFTPVILGG